MGRLASAITLIAGLLLAWHASTPPPVVPANAPATTFSADRAVADVRAIGQRPHPAGSADHARVRAWLIQQMRTVGLTVRAQPGSSLRARLDEGEWRADGADTVNLIGILPGRDRAAPAVALMAHYDSVPGSPGAADDGAGIAAALEIVRALQAGGTRHRDLILLFTDAEEAGLHGARAFFTADPLRNRIGFLINMDVRGDAGRAIMHETGANSGEAIALYARVVGKPMTDSIASDVKRYITNNTDFAIAKEAGVAGLNLSFLGDQFDYHAASSTPDRLDRRSLQDLGDQALAITRATITASRLPQPAPDRAYASLLSWWTVQYPLWGGWLLLAASGLLAFAAWARGARMAGGVRARGVAAAVTFVLACALAIHAVRIGTGVDYGFTVVRPLLARWGWFETAVGLAILAVSLATFTAAARGAPRRAVIPILGIGLACWLIDGFSPVGPILAMLTAAGAAIAFRTPLPRDALPFGLFVITGLLAIIAQSMAPAAAVLLCWSLVAAGIVALLATRAGGWRVTAIVAIGAVALGQIGSIGHAILLTVGENIPEAGALFAMMAAAIIAPLLARAAEEGGTRVMAVACAMAALALTAGIRLGDPASPLRPDTSQILYVSDATTGQSYRISSLARIDPWTRAALRADGHGAGTAAMPPLFARVSIARARSARIDPPPSTIVRLPDGRVRITVAATPDVRDLRVRLASSTPIRRVIVNGIDAPGLMARAQAPATIQWTAPTHGLTILLEPSTPGRIAARLSALRDGWPREARPLPRRPADAMPWYNSDSSVALWTLAL